MADDVLAWWSRVCETAPKQLAGLWFGMVDLAPGGWHLYVAGTSNFDAVDETAEWAVGPYVWQPERGYLPFPGVDGLDIDAALRLAAETVRSIAPWTKVAVAGVAVGFDDGDFEIVFAT